MESVKSEITTLEEGEYQNWLRKVYIFIMKEINDLLILFIDL